MLSGGRGSLSRDRACTNLPRDPIAPSGVQVGVRHRPRDAPPGGALPLHGAALALGLPALAALVALCVVTAWFASEPAARGVAMVAAPLAAICAAFAGIPAAYWAVSTGRGSLRDWAGLGAVAGGLPALVVLIGGGLGALLRGDTGLLDIGPRSMVALLLNAIGIPAVVLRGRGFLAFEVLPMLIGGATGSVFWAVFLCTGSRLRRSGLALALLAIASAVSALVGPLLQRP